MAKTRRSRRRSKKTKRRAMRGGESFQPGAVVNTRTSNSYLTPNNLPKLHSTGPSPKIDEMPV